jgi:hypothetical protein
MRLRKLVNCGNPDHGIDLYQCPRSGRSRTLASVYRGTPMDGPTIATLTCEPIPLVALNERGEWIRLAPEYGNLEIRTRGVSASYERAKASGIRAAALKLGVPNDQLPPSVQQKIEGESLCKEVVTGVRNLTEDDGSESTFARFRGLLKHRGYRLLLGACIRASGGTIPEFLRHPLSTARLSTAFYSSIAGVSFDNDDSTSRQKIIADSVRPGMRLRLCFENDNTFDNNAVALLTPAGQQVGHLHRHLAIEVRDWVSHGFKIVIRVKEVTGGTPEKPTRGVNIFVGVFGTTPGGRRQRSDSGAGHPRSPVGLAG